MDSISIFDGLVLTVVSMLVVFIVLASIWGLVELTARFINVEEVQLDSESSKQIIPSELKDPSTLSANKAHQQAAELISLVLASEDQPDKNFEIVESKRIK